MRTALVLAAALALAPWSVPVDAQGQVQVEAELAPDPVSIEEVARLTIEVRTRSLAQPRFSPRFELDNLAVLGQPHRSETFRFVNGVSMHSSRLTWYLRPLRPGPAAARSIQIELDGDVYDLPDDYYQRFPETVLAVGLENRFRVKLSEEDAQRVRTVEDLVSTIVSVAECMCFSSCGSTLPPANVNRISLPDMDFALSLRAEETCGRMWDFLREHVFPAEPGTGYVFDSADVHQPLGADPRRVTVALHFLVQEAHA